MENGGKLYYGIKEVAEMFDINASKLRYYEKEFPTLQPKKNRSGDRVYTQDDINHLKEILVLINDKGYTLPGAREYIKTRDANRREHVVYINKLKRIKAGLEKLRASLDKQKPQEVQPKQDDDEPEEVL
ncbi:MerR family transcriptional regulator [Spirosoma pollinicola]|uniref:MerR family transcriptional regulator n=1 Tax=Spirosoma pollinicola TaxID=2057025 RepID=A0A2K8Z1Y2_9BACT|nr:MerR family transcriptional regulator [Spirosoma pollinicola]AUD03893.1 MerR family transcriptional regulator [Spirosoma pollinicola]